MSQAPLHPVASADRVDVENVQGDIILGLPKKKQEFVFFVIADSAKFKAAIPSLRVTSTGDVIRSREAIAKAKQANPGSLVPLPLLNIAFSRCGLDALGIKDDLGDTVFSAGQLADARNLGDEGKTIGGKFDPNWEQVFKTRIDAVLLVVGETWVTVNARIAEALKTFGNSVRVVDNLKASVRPGAEKTGDTVRRPGWAVEGSFLAFRQLNQLVPEFHDFLEKNPIDHPGLDRKQGSELLGARLVGRWKSGAPIQLSPLHDDPELAKDPQRNNNFVYPQDKGEEGQTACPYAAHIRKTNPRNDLDGLAPRGVERASMTRAGIPFGPAWANTRNFPPLKAPAGAPALIPGFDPIIGQANGASRTTLGTTGGPQLTLPRDFVVSRGGEYFFSPSIRALKTVFAGKAA
ncbi:hypothetical protein FRC10_000893 [Ceratobasidium sp. 414]|nr:hypothetical protein FRC10_000893 [Ceratobasidium sp. 414]